MKDQCTSKLGSKSDYKYATGSIVTNIRDDDSDRFNSNECAVIVRPCTAHCRSREQVKLLEKVVKEHVEVANVFCLHIHRQHYQVYR